MALVNDVDEAYRLVLEAVEDLRQEGVESEIRPSESTHSSPEDVLPRQKWVVIVFKVPHRSQAAAVRKKCKELGWRGIRFDTSGSSGERWWEVDWSFKLVPPDADWEAAGDDVEDMIDGCWPML